ncbi:MAG: tetratricopeptide repeat protein, partial [Treponema sp.]|nr:tetratricopeptide repeat protein [Treponema sp.]
MMKRFFLLIVAVMSASLLMAQTKSTVKKTHKTVSSKNEKKAAEPTIVYSQDFVDGEELFQLNRPLEAIPLFEKIIDDKYVNPAVFVYLGVAYYQVEEYQKSLNVCVKGLTRPDTDHKVLAYNGGNSAYALGNYARADACYAIAIKEDPNFSAAYLNR